jgi:rfaE bifunctional protein kinase chain/domain
MSDPSPLFASFSQARVLVIGDLMLDRYWWGSVDRISPEAPVPVVNLEKASCSAGGAANVATNAASLGACTAVVGLVGRDETGGQIISELAQAGVDVEGVVISEGICSTVKTRIVAHSQHVVRVDQDSRGGLEPADERELFESVKTRIGQADVVIVSDYAKSVVSDRLLEMLFKEAGSIGVRVLVDPKGLDYSRYKGADLLTPNRREAAESCGLDPTNSSSADRAGVSLIATGFFGSVLVTQGERGMTLFRAEGPSVHFNSSARQVYDVTGAGDTVIASLGVCLSAGTDLVTACGVANIAAGIVVEQVGTTTIKLGDLRRALGSTELDDQTR